VCISLFQAEQTKLIPHQICRKPSLALTIDPKDRLAGLKINQKSETME
jgi:hypothetical protein